MARKRRKSTRKRKSTSKARSAAGNKKLTDKEVFEKFKEHLITENVDPDDIRKSFDDFKKKYNIKEED